MILQREHPRACRIGTSASCASSGQALALSVPCFLLNKQVGVDALLSVSFFFFWGVHFPGLDETGNQGDPVESRHLVGCPGSPSSNHLGPGPEGPSDTSILGPDHWRTSSSRDQSLCLHSFPARFYFTNTSLALTASSKHSAYEL